MMVMIVKGVYDTVSKLRRWAELISTERGNRVVI